MSTSDRIPLLNLSNKRRKSYQQTSSRNAKEHDPKTSKDRGFKKDAKEDLMAENASASKVRAALKEVCTENDLVSWTH